MIIRARDLAESKWKNGGGVTTEILRSPLGAGEYDYRLSLARVESDGPFSEFPGYDRALVVWDGEGLRLNGSDLLPFSVFEFSGETPIQASLIAGPVMDLGCIFRRDLFACAMSVVRSVAGAPGFYFVIAGELQTPEGLVAARDTFVCEVAAAVAACTASADFLAIHVAVQRRG